MLYQVDLISVTNELPLVPSFPHNTSFCFTHSGFWSCGIFPCFYSLHLAYFIIKYMEGLPTNHCKVCSSVAFSASMMLYKHHHHLVLEYFYHPKMKPRNCSSSSPPPKPLATTNLISVSLNLPSMDISYKWNHITRGLLGLGLFT